MKWKHLKAFKITEYLYVLFFVYHQPFLNTDTEVNTNAEFYCPCFFVFFGLVICNILLAADLYIALWNRQDTRYKNLRFCAQFTS